MTQNHTVTLTGAEARSRLLAGARAVAEPVSSTMGPCGLTVLVRSGARVVATKDGATVSTSVQPEHPAESMGAELLQVAAKKTADVAGDGTTTCTVVAAAMLEQAQRAIAANYSQAHLRRELPAAMRSMRDALLRECRQTKSSSEIELVARIAANGDERISTAAATAVEAAGPLGRVHVESSEHGITHAAITDGIVARAEILSAHFANVSGKLACAAEEALVVVSRGKLQSFKSIMGALEAANKKKIALLLLFADYDQAAMQALVSNRTKAGVNVFACKFIRPTWDEVSDIADACGAKAIDSDSEETTVAGSLKRFYADKAGVSLSPADPSHAAALLERLAAKLSDAVDNRERASLEARIAAAASKHAVVRACAPTEAEATELRHRAEDAVAAARGAMTSGVVRGGGCAMLDAFSGADLGNVSDQTREIVKAGAEAPARAILKNAGRSFDWFVSARKNQSDCYDASADAIVSDPPWLIDSALATVTAFDNACSVCRTFVALSSVIYENVEKTPTN